MNDIKHLFAKYQKPIISGLNHWALGTPFRKLLGIDKECKDKITKLWDNAYQTRLGKNKFQATFRCYPVFAKRMGVALSKWDIIKDYIAGNPKLYQGLDEYRGLLAQIGLLNTREFPTVMAASGDPIYSGAGDGSVGNIIGHSNWNDCRTAGTGDYVDYISTTAFYDASFAPTYYLRRLFFPFNTSDLGSIDVSAAVMTIIANQNKVGSPGPMYLVQTSQASNTQLTTADYDAFSYTAGIDGTVNIPTSGNAATFTLNSTGRGWVSGSAWTKLGVIDSDDFNNNAPGGNDYTKFRTSEYADTASDPILVVTYIPALVASQAVWF